ncbi:unnamed protein product [Cyprideis torosa]|uniref:Uncharacterized protein n=1 Tax=Cyprideis torosa TaxID=163714 RepID=A0A7R8WMD1_9CRUS|nr:unnamed protein product [Cyprideis torosa]CAG0905164.1 unnamed protein product [Cyprideis torosa]
MQLSKVLHLTQCPMEAQASHYFSISRSLFSGSMNSILTYMVILVQFKVSFMSTDKSSSEDSNSTEPGNHTGPAIGTI